MADVRAVIFDLDDTLHAERRFVLSGLRHVARLIADDHALEASQVFRVAVRAFRRGPRRDVLQAVCRRFGLREALVPGWVEALRNHPPSLRLPRSSAAALVALRTDGCRLGILTNGLVDVQRRKIAALGLAPLVDAAVCAEAIVPGGKPHRACFSAVVEALGVTFAEAVMVGNSMTEDILGARADGLRTILVARRLPALPGPADAVVTTVRDVPDAVRVLGRRLARVG